MKLYKLPFVMHEPSAETEDKFMAEIPALPGCRAWGDTAAQTLENLQSVAAAFIESYADMGDEKLKRHRLKSRKILFSMRFWLRFELPNTHT